MTARASRFQIPLRLKLAAGASILAAVPIIVVGLWALGRADKRLHADVVELQLALASDISNTVEHQDQETIQTLEGISRVLGDAKLSEDVQLATVKGLVESSNGLDHIDIYGVDRKHLDGMVATPVNAAPVAHPPPATELDPALAARAASATNFAIGDAVRWDADVRVPLVVAIHAGTELTGYVTTEMSLAPLQKRVAAINREILHDLPDGLVVVDAKLRAVAVPDPSLLLLPMSPHEMLDDHRSDVAIVSLERHQEFHARDGTPMAGTLMPVVDRPYAVVVQVPQSLAYAELAALRRLILIAVAIAVVVSTLLAFLFARQLTRPIGKLVALASALGARRFDARAAVTTRDELAVLATAMNDAGRDLAAGEQRLREELAIRTDLGRYVSQPIVDTIIQRKQDMNLGGKRRDVSVVFADVVGFTALSERLPAEDVVTILNELFTILTEVVFRHQGTVDKFIGDCVMAVWGTLLDQPDHATRAVAAAQDMRRWLDAGNAGWQHKYGVTIQLAIGINSGAAVAGNIGSTTRMEYTVIGDLVNVAARAEAMARPQQILVTRATRDAAGDGFEYLDIGTRGVVGRVGSIELFEVRK